MTDHPDAVKVLESVLQWAEARCPCENEEPNPCPLCGASVENLEPCKSAENTLPRHLLKELRSVKARAMQAAVPAPAGVRRPSDKKLLEAYALSDLICPETTTVEAEMLGIWQVLSAIEDAGAREGAGLPSDGSCARCGAVPRNASGLCATCVDEDAERAGEIESAAAQGLWRQALDQERVPTPAGAGDLVERPLLPAAEWAVERWNAEVKNRPLRNVHRRSLDDTWRQVIRYFGGDAEALCGPAHDDLVAANPSAAVRDAAPEAASRIEALEAEVDGWRKATWEAREGIVQRDEMLPRLINGWTARATTAEADLAALRAEVERLEGEYGALADTVGKLGEDLAGAKTSRNKLQAEVERKDKALRKADQFIGNGIALGFIRMPDADTPDSAHETPGIVQAALAPAKAGG